MRKAQMSSMDITLSFVIILGVIAFSLIVLQGTINDRIKNQQLDKYVVYQNLMRHIEAEKEYLFLNQSHLDLEKLERFGALSQTNISRFRDFFLKDYFMFGSVDICIFVLDKDYDFVYINTTQYAFGMMSNETVYDAANLIDCQRLIGNGQNPCDFYEKSETLTKAALLNDNYVTLYFVFCH